MTSDEQAALRDAKGFAGAGRIVFGAHARQRMRLRRASERDVRNALMTATACRDQRADVGRVADWFVSGGTDEDGDALDCAVSFDGAVAVVTIYTEA